jgi:predicted GIY-YIG superfamily endonuclease
MIKKKYVYELINLMGTIEYVGETNRPEKRFYEHTKLKYKSDCGVGKFYGRQDLIMNIVKEFDDTKSCFRYETELKIYYGLIPSEHINRRQNGIKSSSKPVIVTNIKTGEVKEFYGLQNACLNLGLNLGEAGRVARGGRTHHKGYCINYKKYI